uniref:Nitrate/nitrite transporter NarK n=1 Tax=Candidatus Kentrum sp. DK TaxID=2126562 RepID=A0A450TA76_9GAMM|nr:MAG: Nitrate/nitrite transporter NarK [Candidatus Kentron sp. DK]
MSIHTAGGIDNPDRFRRLWVLFLCGLSNLFTGLAWMSMPVLFQAISQEKGWTIAQLLTAWGVVQLAVLLSGIPAGIVSDRIGMRWTVGIGLVAFGLFGAARGVAENYRLFVVFLFFFGFLVPFIYQQLYKITAQLFDRERLGVVHGSLQATFGVATGIAFLFSGTLFSRVLGGWQNLFYLLGTCSAILGLVWMMTVRGDGLDARDSVCVPRWQVIGKEIYRLMRNRNIRMFSLINFLAFGAWIGASGTLPSLLRDSHGLSAQSANGIMALASWSWIIGSLVLPHFFDRFRDRRYILVTGLTVSGLALLVLCASPDSGMLWFWSCLWGFSASILLPVMVPLVFHTPGVDRQSAGTAAGIVFSTGNLGGFVFPMIITAWVLEAGQPTVMLGILCGLLGYALAGLLVLRIPPDS